jgi:hypothetical protein
LHSAAVRRNHARAGPQRAVGRKEARGHACLREAEAASCLREAEAASCLREAEAASCLREAEAASLRRRQALRRRQGGVSPFLVPTTRVPNVIALPAAWTRITLRSIQATESLNKPLDRRGWLR